MSDPTVCRPYLCGSCPFDLFTNTKMDTGPCKKVHIPNLREEYQSKTAEEKERLGYEFDYMREVYKWTAECDRKIDNAHRRLEKTPEERQQTNSLLSQVSELTKTIDAGLIEVEVLAEEGAVNLAVQDFHNVKMAKIQKEDKERELKAIADTSGPSGHQKLQVCDVCGAYLSRLDNDRRLADHFFGKMHLGYAAMRKEGERLQKELKGRQPPPGQSDYQDDNRNGYNDGGYGYGSNRGFGRGGGGGGGFGRGGGFGGRRGRW